MEKYTFQVIALHNGTFVIKLFADGLFKGYYGPLDPTCDEDTITSRLVTAQNDAQPFAPRGAAMTYATETLTLAEQE